MKEDNVLSLSQVAASGLAAPSSRMSDEGIVLTSDQLLTEIKSSLADDKAEEVITIDLRGKSEMGDYMVICSGRSSRQVSAIAQNLTDHLKQNHGRLAKVEGKEAGDWVLIDTGDVIVHVFRPEVREFYQLEKMWLNPGDAQA